MSTVDKLNPLLQSWSGPFGGVPPFDRMDVAALPAALTQAMEEQLHEIAAIASNPAPPTFENTIVELERTGCTLQRVLAIYHVYTNNLSDAAVQAVEREMEPKLAAFHDRITQNSALFARIAAVYAARQQLNLDAEQQRLVWLRYTHFLHEGAQLDVAAKARLAVMNQELALLYTEFAQHVLADESEHIVVLEQVADLAGLPASVSAGAAAEALARGMPGKWVIANTRSSVEPFLQYSTRRDLRERVWRMFVSRGDSGNGNDNKKIIRDITRLRAERAQLLGFESFAHWSLDDSMAQTPQQALQLLESIWPAARERARAEIVDMQQLAAQTLPGMMLEAWDHRFYTEQVRKTRFALDTDALKPYLQLEQLREGMFYVAQRLFDVRFMLLDSQVPVFHPDVRVWAVEDAQQRALGLWFFDPFARRGKQSGAWMSSYRDQESFAGSVPAIVSNNANFVKGHAGEPVLISWDDAVTLFHEFGHALHGLLSQVRYPSLSGTAVARDFVEFPSQLFEHWLATPEVLQRFAVHYQTGAPLPDEWIVKLERAKNFNQGFMTAEFLGSAWADMQLHLNQHAEIDPIQFEQHCLTTLRMPSQITMRHRLPHFAHIFAGDGYAAGYYSYLWADVLVADAWEAFNEGAGPWDLAVAQRLRDCILSVGNTQDPAAAYRAFRGRDPDSAALLRKRGLVVTN